MKLLLFIIVFVDCKYLINPILTSLKSKDLPEDATLDYAYMTKNRTTKPQIEHEPVESVDTETKESEIREPGIGKHNSEELENLVKGNLATNNAQSGTFGENSGNMSNNTNSNNTTTNNYHTEKGFKDDIPVGTMQTTPNIKNTTDTSNHKGDTSTFVTNNFYNPSKNDNNITIGGELEYEYLWKRIYDIDEKLSELNPINLNPNNLNPLKRKGIVFSLNRLILLFSNLFIIFGFFFLLGSNKFFIFFSKRRKGTGFYLIGVSLIVIPIYELNNKFGIYIQLFGIILQLFGCYYLFHEFLPNLISYLKLTPLNTLFKINFINKLFNFLTLKQLPT
ncbi:uncharacterized protein TA09320 [Theileria annulata]|uniref:Got1/Sft2-like family n=1 Tax=Theileria annulata TaxID=5874 RepID=Q4UAE3_THEAN|nr:uncharacterized protein TA09320 [Theileria annulata]CAI76208.1 hypothetical protein TA09320 [Theileria annulata]|eukprot:XP_952833.1 hypothetical protein TA09320 [Theileria annulata]